MTDPRRSYLKTILSAVLPAVLAIAVAVAMFVAAWRGSGTWGWGRWVVFGGVLALLGIAVAGLGLVALGGSIAVWRTGLEARGVPYARTERREWIPGPGWRWLRELLRTLTASPRGGDALRPGDLVEVKSLAEILETLDERAMLDGLPFMGEMAAFCGQRHRVFRRVEKIHDYVTHTGLRRMRSAVLLDALRCDGSAHGGCQACCHLIWKEAWLRRVPERVALREVVPRGQEKDLRPDPAPPGGVWAASSQVRDESGEVRYVCQMTEVARASTPQSWGDPRHYLRDLVTGNVRPSPLLRGVAIAVFNGVQRRRGGVVFPHYRTTREKTSPHAVLDLQPGEWVRVRTKREIEETLTIRRRNRGLWFDGEMVRFCGGVYRVATRIDRLIKENSGSMIAITNPCIVLEGVTASAEYLGLCAQNEVIMWREIWLERVEAGA